MIDSSVELDHRLFHLYSDYVIKQLEKRSAGTKLATYWSDFNELLLNYEIESVGFNGKLKMLLKTC